MVRIYDIPDNTFETDEEEDSSEEESTDDSDDDDGKFFDNYLAETVASLCHY